MAARTPNQTLTHKLKHNKPLRTAKRQAAKERAKADLNKPLRVRLGLTKH